VLQKDEKVHTEMIPTAKTNLPLRFSQQIPSSEKLQYCAPLQFISGLNATSRYQQGQNAIYFDKESNIPKCFYSEITL